MTVRSRTRDGRRGVIAIQNIVGRTVARDRLRGFDRDDVPGRTCGHLFAAVRAVELVVDRVSGNTVQAFALQHDGAVATGAFNRDGRELRYVWHVTIRPDFRAFL